jgi:hypothetical protein
MSILYFIAILYAIAGAIFIGSIIFTLLRAAYCYITGWEPEVNMDPLSREDAEFMREYLFIMPQAGAGSLIFQGRLYADYKFIMGQL